MSVLALGTAQFGLQYGIANQQGQVPLAEVASIVARATAVGVDTVDTAIAYGNSERCLGHVGVSDFRVITKLPAVPAQCRNVTSWVCAEIEESLARLQVPCLGGVLLHRPQQLLENCGPELFNALQSLREQGRISKVGVSIYAPSELDQLCERYDLDIVQAPFNLVDRALHTSGWLDRLSSNGVEVHARSAFLQGLLLMPREQIPANFSAWKSIWDRWHDWLKHNDVSALQACIAFSFSFPHIHRVVVGVDSLMQWEQIITASTQLGPASFPNIACDDPNLVNPARWKNI